MYSQCEVHHAAAKTLTNCGEMGVYVPRCEKDGSYSPVQCDDGGYCCCADAVTGKRQKSTCVRAPKMPECRKEGIYDIHYRMNRPSNINTAEPVSCRRRTFVGVDPCPVHIN